MDILQELKKGFEDFKAAQLKADTDLKALVQSQADAQAKGLKENSEEIKALMAKAEESTKQVQTNADKILELEQKLVKGIHAGKEPVKSLGQLVLESDSYKRFASGQDTKCKVTLKQAFSVFANTITGQGGSPADNVDTLVPAQRVPGIVPGAFRRLRVRDIIPGGRTNSNAIEATRELTFTNAAAETAEGATKPEATLTFELYTAPVRTIAHWLKLSRQVRDDAPALMTYIDTRLRYGVDLREDQQLIAGDGTGQNLTGMTIAPNFTAFTPLSAHNALDSINYAKETVDVADYMATAIVLNPADWGNIERTKVGASDDRYVVGDPRSAMGPFLWGLPVVVTNSMTSGKILIAAFDIAFQLFDREETTVEMSESDDTNFQKNLITVRAEKRCVLAGYRPASVLYGNLTV